MVWKRVQDKNAPYSNQEVPGFQIHSSFVRQRKTMRGRRMAEKPRVRFRTSLLPTEALPASGLRGRPKWFLRTSQPVAPPLCCSRIKPTGRMSMCDGIIWKAGNHEGRNQDFRLSGFQFMKFLGSWLPNLISVWPKNCAPGRTGRAPTLRAKVMG